MLGNKKLTLSEFKRFLDDAESIAIGASVKERIQASFKFLQRFAQNKIIYGINTGMGPMAQFRVDAQNGKQLQLNLIRSHSAGSGKFLTIEHARSTMLARLHSLTLGYSGIHIDAVQLLTELLNKRVTCCIPERGGVGASGDLVQLAHLALNLIGEGQVFYDNKICEAKNIFDLLLLKPLEIHIREALAIMNGTSAMTGIGIINVLKAKKLLAASTMLSAIVNELMESFDDHFSEQLNAVKLHDGQQTIASEIREILKDSNLMRKRKEFLYSTNQTAEKFDERVQEYYSLRCVPQILGPIKETIEKAEIVIENELNSVSDNPIIDAENEQVYHGGNFHGDYVALEMDKLKIVIAKLSMLAERQLNYLMNPNLNGRLTPFINTGKLGLNFGLQGMQFTATSCAAENQTLSNPMYVHSISNNNDNQDIVSMGCNASLITDKVIDNAFTVLAIESIAIMQAANALGVKSKMATATLQFCQSIEAIIPPFETDEPKYEAIENVRQFLAY